MAWIILIVSIILIIILLKIYNIKYDTIIAFTGGLGSGKSYLSVSYSKKLLRKNRKIVKFKNFIIKIKNKFRKKDKQLPYLEKPMLYSSIPVRISKKEWSIKLDDDYLLLRKKLSYKAVTFIDEVGSFASQFEYNNPNVKNAFDEFVRLYRHYTKGGYLVVNDQCSENIVLTIRRRINTVFNLMDFKKHLFLFYTVKIRNVCISEEIKTIEDQNVEDGMKVKFGIIGFGRSYDTYCYSDRYNTVPESTYTTYKKFKKNSLLKVPRVKKEALTNNNEEE